MTGSHGRAAAGVAAVLLAVGLAACGGTSHHAAAAGSAAAGSTVTSTSTTSTHDGIITASTVSTGTGTVQVGTAAERQWEAAIQAQTTLPRGPKGWRKLSSPTSTSFINGDPYKASGGNLGILFGNREGLLEFRCSNTTTIYPTAYGTRSGPLKITTSTTGYPTGVTGDRPFHTALKPVHCVNPDPATSDGGVVLAQRYQASEVIPNVNQYNVPSIAFRLSNSAAVQVVFYSRR